MHSFSPGFSNLLTFIYCLTSSVSYPPSLVYNSSSTVSILSYLSSTIFSHCLSSTASHLLSLIHSSSFFDSHLRFPSSSCHSLPPSTDLDCYILPTSILSHTRHNRSFPNSSTPPWPHFTYISSLTQEGWWVDSLTVTLLTP